MIWLAIAMLFFAVVLGLAMIQADRIARTPDLRAEIKRDNMQTLDRERLR